MDYIQLFKILGSASIAFIIYLIIKEIAVIIQNRNIPPNSIQRIKALEKTVDNDYRHEFDNIWVEIRGIRAEINSFKDKVDSRINNLENRITKLEGKYGK